MADQRKRVAILGGGMGALTAAYQLSEDPQYEVTVYQLGWRLGGQGASGRNLAYADRIEEHGLHVWFGFYENAFNLMRRCYDELGRPASAPLATVDQAFHPVNVLTILEQTPSGERVPWVVEFPRNGLKPGFGGEAFTIWGSLVNMVTWMFEFWERWPVDGDGKPPSTQPPDPSLFDAFRSALPDWVNSTLQNVSDAANSVYDRAEGFLVHQVLELIQLLPHDHTQHRAEDHNVLVWLIAQFANHTWNQFKDQIDTNPQARRLWTLIYLGCTAFAGMIQDRVLFDGFDPLDQYDLTDWFYDHKLVDDQRANDLAYRSAPTQTIYDLLFHYQNGDTSKPRIAAGIGLLTTLRIMFGYKGAVLWFMQSAMGDTIFAPLYEVLSRRGVKFKFFHRVTNLQVDGDTLVGVELSRQVNLTVGEYDPLVLIKDLPCWPSEPLYDQIVEGEQLKRDKINLERSTGWTNWHDTGGTLALKAGVDFDHAILGIGIGALPPICQELTRKACWHDMLANIQTVQTQAVQLWFKPGTRGLGIRPFMHVIGAYDEPFSSLTDFTHLLKRENWPHDDGVHHLIYSCGVLDERPGETQPEADERVKQIVLHFLKYEYHPLWPKADDPHDPHLFDWDDLVAPADEHGDTRLDAQYLRANVDPVERYVLSLPGTNQYRLKAGGSGFHSLILAGNWIDTGFNIACIETAVMSGMQAARVLTGEPEYIVGEPPILQSRHREAQAERVAK